jgi:MATE family multidrug resistance protein
VWRIALPMILSNISVPMLGMVDTGVTGHLDNAAYLGAVAVGSTIFGFLYVSVNFLRMGTTGMAAQRFGADDYDGVRVTLGQALIIALLIAFFLLAFHVPLGHIALNLLGPDAVVREYASEYFHIRIWSAPATLASYALIGWFIGLQNARVPLIMVLFTNVINIVLDLWFVVVLDWKVEGVAAASVIAEYSGIVVGLTFAWVELGKHEGHWILSKLTTISEYKAFLAVNGNLFIRTIALAFTFAFVTAQGARYGGLILAANAILMNLQHLLAFALDGLAHAAEALVGKSIGARSRDAFEASVSITLRWSLLIAAGFSVLFYVGGPILINVLTDLTEVRETTLAYLPWLVLSPLVSVLPFLYDGVFVGATKAKEMRNIMVISTVIVFLPTWYVLQFLGNHGLWLAFIIFMASRSVGMHYYYRRHLLPGF